ncbi:MAG TPA: ATP-binding cassette domain-containing protein [Pirellulales bacterium]|nr:ATP-binding cassette domain-containing protein [Pirellulales bacterium]
MNSLVFQCRHRYPGSAFQLDVSFETSATVTGLFGRSGAGKTTVLAILAGFLQPEHGRVLVGDDVLVDTARRLTLPPERRRIGYVVQDHLLFPHLSVARNLRYGLRRAASTEPAVDFDEVVQILELRPLLDRSPVALSGGERQRVALGRALLARPRLLLMDEPLAALDQALKLRILDFLERIVDRWHVPTLYVSHVAAEIRRLAEQVVVLEAGGVTSLGTPDESLGDR